MDAKLNNFITLAGTIATLNVGIGFFVLDRISTTNPFFIPLILALLAGVFLFVSTIFMGLNAYKPSYYFMTPKDPKRYIEEYADLTKTHVLRETAMTMADVVSLNRKRNFRKVRSLTCLFWFIIFGTLAIVFFAVFMVLALWVPPP